MKNRRNKIGMGILSLALALALPLNANATEAKKPIKNEETKTETTPTPTRQTDRNTNYISQRDKEEEDKIQVKAYPVEFKTENNGADNLAQLSYMFAITGTDLPEDYTISVFALKDSKVKNFELDNFISENKVTIAGEDMTEAAEKIASDDIFGFRIKTKITYSGSVKAIVTVGDEDEAGDYSLYYVITTKDKTAVGKIDASLEKIGANTFVNTTEQEKRDYYLSDKDKENPFENLPFTKYLLNDTDEDKNLEDYMDLIAARFGSCKLLATYINPNTEEVETEVINNPEEYVIPANSVLRFEIKEGFDTSLIKDAEIAAYDLEISEGKAPISLMSMMANKQMPKTSLVPKDKAEEADIEKLIEVEKASLRKLYPKMDPETLEIKSLAQAINKQNEKLRDLIDDESLPIPPMAEIQKTDASTNKNVEKKSVIDIKSSGDVGDLETKDLAQAIREVTSDIHELIQQALLDYELDKLSELDKEQAKEEYKKIAQLVKEGQAVSKKANNKLIELDKIILADNPTDPLVKRVEGAKPVLNLGMLTPLTKINNLTKDSPKESERYFSTNLEKKLEKAVKKVETVTIGGKDDKKADKKDDKAKDNKDPNKDIIVADQKAKDKAKEADKDKTKGNQAKIDQEINTPIFVKYLQTLNSRGKLLDNK